MNSNNKEAMYLMPNEYIRLMLKERGHSNSFLGVTNVVMSLPAEKDIVRVLQDTFAKFGFGIGVVQITAIGDSYVVKIDNLGAGQLTDDLDYHQKYMSGPAMQAAQEVGFNTDYILKEWGPVWKEGAPGGLAANEYWFVRRDSL